MQSGTIQPLNKSNAAFSHSEVLSLLSHTLFADSTAFSSKLGSPYLRGGTPDTRRVSCVSSLVTVCQGHLGGFQRKGIFPTVTRPLLLTTAPTLRVNPQVQFFRGARP